MTSLNLLKEKMEGLNSTQQLDMVRILLKNNIKFSENSNGVFINLTHLSDAEIEEITKYITYISDQEANLSTIENMKKEYKKNFFMDSKEQDESISEQALPQ
jgi:hypothetical protein